MQRIKQLIHRINCCIWQFTDRANYLDCKKNENLKLTEKELKFVI